MTCKSIVAQTQSFQTFTTNVNKNNNNNKVDG